MLIVALRAKLNYFSTTNIHNCAAGDKVRADGVGHTQAKRLLTKKNQSDDCTVQYLYLFLDFFVSR